MEIIDRGEIMDFKTDAKKTCPKCGSQTKKATINFEGIDIAGRLCESCNWSG